MMMQAAPEGVLDLVDINSVSHWNVIMLSSTFCHQVHVKVAAQSVCVVMLTALVTEETAKAH